jgi:hypothetical protein
MYERVETAGPFLGVGGNEVVPVATLRDGDGGVCHVAVDDHCYVLYLKHAPSLAPEGCLEPQDGVWFRETAHVFREAHALLAALPPPP